MCYYVCDIDCAVLGGRCASQMSGVFSLVEGLTRVSVGLLRVGIFVVIVGHMSG